MESWEIIKGSQIEWKNVSKHILMQNLESKWKPYIPNERPRSPVRPKSAKKSEQTLANVYQSGFWKPKEKIHTYLPSRSPGLSKERSVF